MKINQLLTRENVINSYIYNLNLTLTQEQLDLFSGIRYVIMQGSNKRTYLFALKLMQEFLDTNVNLVEPKNMFYGSGFCCYRVGNILSVSHGMGSTSILTLLHDLSKIMYFANNNAVEYIRVGTSGGIGIPAGSVVLTDLAFMPNLVQGYKTLVLGQEIIYSAIMDVKLNKRILAAQPQELGFKVLEGNSIAADDFYLGQARFDGVINPNYDEKERQQYFAKIQELNILNFEMESTALASFCNRADIPATMIAATLVNRVIGDQITESADILDTYANRAHAVAINYLKSEKVFQ